MGEIKMKTNIMIRKVRYTLFTLLLIAAFLLPANVDAAGGMLDTSFGSNGIVVTDLGSPSDTGVNLVLQTDGKIVLAGTAQLDSSNPNNQTSILVRYNPNGTLDTTFGTNGKVTTAVGGPVALQTDGKLIVGGGMAGAIGLARYNSNGTLDNTFGTNGIVSVWENDNSNFQFSFGDLAVQPDGKIVVVGIQEAIGGNHVYCVIARFHENGVLEEDSRAFFDESNFPESERNYCKAVALQPDGKIILSGHAEPNFTGMAIILGRLKDGSTSSFDPAFGTNGQGTVVTPIASFKHGNGALAIQADGKIVLAGTTYADQNNVNENLTLVRYNSNGTLDSTLGGSGIVITDLGVNEVGDDLAIQADGKIIVAGKSYSDTSSDFLLARYNADGTLDSSFGNSGKAVLDLGGSDSAEAILLQPDNKVLAVGTKNGDAALVRYVGNTTAPTAKTFKAIGSYDGWILESSETGNTGGTLNTTATTVNAGDDPKDKQYRSILSFQTSSLPDNALITSVQVKIRKQGLVGTDPFTTHGSLLLDIRNGLFSNNLDLKLSDFSAPASSSQWDKFSASTNSWYTANLRSSNLAFMNRFGPTQFRFRFYLDDNDDLSADYVKFFSGDATTENQPQLIVTYVLPQ
jgi:uncharacterized delta-60 repeat protein